jgi:hypothetical protein
MFQIGRYTERSSYLRSEFMEVNMIPNALTKTGPEASYWVHLKSIDHTLQRILSTPNLPKLEELDVDRLEALVSFLKEAVSAEQETSVRLVPSLAERPKAGVDYRSAMDWKKRIESVKSFYEYWKSSKKSFEESVERLILACNSFVSASQKNLIPAPIPHREIAILKDIIGELLSEVEVTLHD